MKDITIVGMEPNMYGVQLIEAPGVETSHRVRVPEGFAGALGVADVDAELLVRETFAFLLEREPATSILQEFSLEDVERYFPEYRDEITARVSGGR